MKQQYLFTGPETDIIGEILEELARAKKKHPSWPEHMCARAGVVVEEAGELMQAALQWKYERELAPEMADAQYAQLRTEAIHTAASAIRFIQSLEKIKNHGHNQGTRTATTGGDQTDLVDSTDGVQRGQGGGADIEHI